MTRGTSAGWGGPGRPDAGLRVRGGVGGAAACLEDLDGLARALADASADAGTLAARAVGAAAEPGLLAAAAVDPSGVARVVLEAARGAAALCRAAAVLAALSAAVTGAVAVYRAREEALAAVARSVPLAVGAAVRGRVAVAVTLPAPGGPALGLGVAAAAAGAAGAVGGALAARGPGAAREAVTGAVVDRPVLVDGAVRLLPGLLGLPDVVTAARAAGMLGGSVGAGETGVVSTPVTAASAAGPAAGAAASAAGPAAGAASSAAAAGAAAPATDAGAAACADPRAAAGGGVGPGVGGRAAGGVADLLRRGQTVAAWREPRAGEHDTLPPGQARPSPGQVRVDRVEAADGSVAWVVHVPGTQDWDADGGGSPMDMVANVGLVAGRRTAVADGVAGALVGAGARRGEPVLLVGHSQGGMTALDLAADPVVRRAVTVTHVVTAGSPVTGRTPPAGVQVLALEHDDDLVPRLDGRSHPDRHDRVVVRAPAPQGPWRSDAVPAHSSSAYVVTAAAVDASHHPSLVAYRAGLAPFLDRDGASCSSRQVVLSRAPRPPGGPR